jgi:hypothetical protein
MRSCRRLEAFVQFRDFARQRRAAHVDRRLLDDSRRRDVVIRSRAAREPCGERAASRHDCRGVFEIHL